MNKKLNVFFPNLKLVFYWDKMIKIDAKIDIETSYKYFS